jgi:mRNA interferase RelE/StbE
MFQVVLSNRAEKSLKKLGKSRGRILDLLVTLRENPVPADTYHVRKMEGETNSYRVRLGDLRVVYDVDWVSKKIFVHIISPRESAYKGS